MPIYSKEEWVIEVGSVTSTLRVDADKSQLLPNLVEHNTSLETWFERLQMEPLLGFFDVAGAFGGVVELRGCSSVMLQRVGGYCFSSQLALCLLPDPLGRVVAANRLHREPGVDLQLLQHLAVVVLETVVQVQEVLEARVGTGLRRDKGADVALGILDDPHVVLVRLRHGLYCRDLELVAVLDEVVLVHRPCMRYISSFTWPAPGDGK